MPDLEPMQTVSKRHGQPRTCSWGGQGASPYNGRMREIYDAVLVLSFGGPEQTDDVIPFLENVLRGKNVPRERMLEVAEHYYHFGGRSPINDQNRELIAALRSELEHKGPSLPVYWGNRNWHPFLTETLHEMRKAGIKRALAFVTSAFSSYSGCRQYLEDIEKARTEVGEGAPIIEKLRGFFNHPGFVSTMVERVQNALERFPEDRRQRASLLFTAHSIPTSMASGSPYVAQLEEACSLVAAGVGHEQWTLAYQSRSGPPTQPWLEPDVLDVLRDLGLKSCNDVVIVPIGFISDHMEVLYDLDTEAVEVAANLNINIVRAATAGAHPRFVEMIRELIVERVDATLPIAIGALPPPPTFCAPDCCPAPRRPTSGSPRASL